MTYVIPNLCYIQSDVLHFEKADTTDDTARVRPVVVRYFRVGQREDPQSPDDAIVLYILYLYMPLRTTDVRVV